MSNKSLPRSWKGFRALVFNNSSVARILCDLGHITEPLCFSASSCVISLLLTLCLFRSYFLKSSPMTQGAFLYILPKDICLFLEVFIAKTTIPWLFLSRQSRLFVVTRFSILTKGSGRERREQHREGKESYYKSGKPVSSRDWATT